MKVCLLNHAKLVGDSGGLAKVNIDFANALSKRGYEVVSVHSDDREGDFFYPLSENVRTYNLQKVAGHIVKMPAHYKLLREVLRPFGHARAMVLNDIFYERYLTQNLRDIFDAERPDVIVAFQPLAVAHAVFDAKTDIPVIGMSHGEPVDYFVNYPKKEWSALGHAKALQVLLPGFETSLYEHFPTVPVKVIGNVVPTYERRAELSKAKERYKIIFLGRLVKNHKQPHHLVQAFSRLADSYSDWDVEIWGANDRANFKARLEKDIRYLGLESRIYIKGTTKDVESVLQTGDIFAFPSRVEGFGLTLAEAMAMGLPALCYASCQASALIEDGVTGLLAEDGVDGFTKGLERLMRDKDLRVRLGEKARDAMHVYHRDTIYTAWEELLQACVGKG